MSEQSDRNIVKIPLSSVRLDESNPRKEFIAIDEFAESLQDTNDIEVPIIVEELGGGGYILVDGERRLRSAKKAGLNYIWADVRKSLSPVERGILRAKLNFQHWNWETGEGVKQLNGLYDAWLETKHEERLSEKKGRRLEFARLIGISDRSLEEKLAFGDTARQSGIKSVPALDALMEERMTFEAARKIAHRTPATQQAIIARAEELRKRQDAPIITKKEIIQARAEYEVRRPESKDKRDAEAYDDIQKAFRRIAYETSTIRDRAKFIYKADSAREAMEMMDSLGQSFLSIEADLEKRFPALKPRRVSR